MEEPRKRREVSRREFIRLSAIATAGVAVAACASGDAEPQDMPVDATVEPAVDPTAAEPAVEGQVYNEAPELAELVRAGELPSVDERLPGNPVVVEPLNEVGVYGGSLRTVMVSERGFQVRSSYGPEGILRIARDNGTIVPNLAESWEYNDEGTVFTLTLNEGIKWSDGEPFNADSVMYWWEAYILNDELNPVKPSWLVTGGELAQLEKVDDNTVRFTFTEPYPFLILRLGHAQGSTITPYMASHYLQQFHPDYTSPEEAQQLAEAADFENWYEYYENRASNTYGMPFQNVDLPTLLPYRLERPLSENIMVCSRNPYYWKVDTAGNQLPYINQVIVTNTEDAEVANAIIASGEINFSVAFVAQLANFPLYQQNAEANNYQVLLFGASEGTALNYQPNQTSGDPVLREMFSDVRFRQALSLALDRDTINRAVYQGLGRPYQTHVIPASKFYVQEMTEAFTEYDPEQANQLLDEMGLTERDGDGFRLRPDGEPLIINLQYTDVKDSFTPNAELAQEFWADVGLQFTLTLISGELLETRMEANELDFGLWHADKSSDVIFPQRPEWYVPWEVGWEKPWGVQWARWYTTDGEEGEEPPAEVMANIERWEGMQRTLDEDEQIRLGREILQSQADNLWTIGTVGDVPEPVIIGSNLRNFPEEGYTGFDWLNTYPYHVEQMYFEGGEWAGNLG